jgi:Tfp pilus assembly protein PilE
MRARGGLSYVRILLVAAVLGMVAKISVPRFSEAGEEAKVCELIDRLEEVRAHLDLYRAHHNGLLAPRDSSAAFESALTTRCGSYLPYISEMPANPFNGLKSVRFDGEPAGCGTAGWRLDSKSGFFQADNSVEHAAL